MAGIGPGSSGEAGSSFSVRAIPGYSRHYVGRSVGGQPSLLLGSDAGPFHAPVRLALLEARFGNLHRIRSHDGEEREELLSVITCTSEEVQAQSYFLHVCETIVRIVGDQPTLPDIVSAVQRLIDLFRHIARPATRSLNGLLGELILIAASRNLPATVGAWRSSDYDRFDFSTGDVRLDVKAAADRTRAHHLSAEQCQPPPGTAGLLASVFIESSGGGQSLGELLQVIETALAGRDDLILKVQQAVAETLGDTLPSAMEARFDDHLARSSIQFYDLMTVPAIRGGVPPEVSKIHFRSDLTQIAPLTRNDVEAFPPSAWNLLPTFR
ncbi:PD-(D/E)XK motif protein [Sphingomonas sp.]|uniref:PD-(D/E)XK motif protein n=1 Tax=Sphingomonas sp. TaxID=28214 RepID=UPI0039C93FF6